MNDYSAERDNLCRRFRESLTKPISERFYDEEELVDLFDYAGDLNDDYLRMEVLLSGARLYPDSEPLRLRRAIFYSYFEGDAEQKFFQDNDGEGLLWEILKLRHADLNSASAEEQFRTVLDKYETFDDEEIIQFVQAAVNQNLYDWLRDNIEVLRQHTEYSQTLYFELAVMAEERDDYETAVKMLEQLTEIEPENPSHWFMLARDLVRLDRPEEALNAVEFALTLSPENRDIRRFRVRLFLSLDTELKQALADIKSLRELEPEDPELLELYFNLHEMLHGTESTDAELNSMLETGTPTYGATTLFLLRHDLTDPKMFEEGVRLVEMFYLSNLTNETNTRANWITWAKMCLNAGHRMAAFLILSVYARHSNDKLTDVPFYLELCVLMRHDDEALDILSDLSGESAASLAMQSPAMGQMILTVWLRNGYFSQAVEMMEAYRSAPPINTGSMSADELMQHKLFNLVLDTVQTELRDPDSHTKKHWQKFDPFVI